MAQLTAVVGVTLHDPIVTVEGDIRTAGWAGGSARSGIARTDIATTFAPASGVVDLYAGFRASIPGVRSVGSGVSFPRFADNLTLSPLPTSADIYVGYKSSLSLIRTAAASAPGQRTSAGITFLNPVTPYIVTTPPVTYTLGNKADRLQRFQRFGGQAVFYKDQGSTNTRLRTGRNGVQLLRDAGLGTSQWTRADTAAMDLASLKAAGQMVGGARVRTGADAADLVVVLAVGGTATRHHVDRAGMGLLFLTDLGGFAGRSGTGQSVLMVPETGGSDGFYWDPTPYVWPGGGITPANLPQPPADTAEWGLVWVPSGTVMPLHGTDVNAMKWIFKGWEDTGNLSAGFYWGAHDPTGGPTLRQPSTAAMYFPSGDLYTYAYGTKYDFTDPTEVPPDALPPPPAPLVSHASIPSGPHPVARYAPELRQPPANDRLRTFTLINGASGSVGYSDVAASLEPSEPDLSFGTQPSRGSVWFSWVSNFDGEAVLAAPGAGIEVYTGPAPSGAPVIGVNGYRGAYDPTASYFAGETVLYNSLLYTTSADITGMAPDAPDTFGPDVKVTGLVTSGTSDLPLGQRVTLQPGTYYYIGDGGDAGYYTGATLTPSGPITQGTVTNFASDGQSWVGLNNYRYPFALYDSVTGSEVGRLGPFAAQPFGQGYHLSQQFVVTAPITFDTLRIDASNYAPDASDYYGIAIGIGFGPDVAVWARGVINHNPWAFTPDTNPLTFANLMPVGGGPEQATIAVRPGDRLYIRTYPMGEASDTRTLTWSTQAAVLAVTIGNDVLPSAPGVIGVGVANAEPGRTVEFRLDTAPTVVATGVADNDGFLNVPVSIPSISMGMHLLIAQEVGTVRTGNAIFTVGDTQYAPPDPTPTPGPVVIVPPPAPIPSWFLQDPTTQTVYAFPINPESVDPTTLPRQLTPAHTTAVAGQPIVFEGGRRARRWSMRGHLFTLAEVDELRSWVRPYRIYATDDLGRTFIIKVLGVQTTPVRDTERPGHHTYAVTCLLYGRVSS